MTSALDDALATLGRLPADPREVFCLRCADTQGHVAGAVIVGPQWVSRLWSCASCGASRQLDGVAVMQSPGDAHGG